MSIRQELVQVKPIQLGFSFESQEEIKRSFHLGNKTNGYVAFKVKSSNPSLFWASPNFGVLQPSSNFEIVVTKYAKVHGDINCEEKIIVQNIFAPDKMVVKSMRDVTNLMKGSGKTGHEVMIPIVYLEGREGSIANIEPEILEEQQEEDEEEEQEKEAIPVSTEEVQFSYTFCPPNRQVDALYRAEVLKREKIEEELAKVKKELEESKELQQKVCCIDFSFEELQKATNGFDEKHKLGEGGYGDVYKGVLHHTPVAIKKLKEKKGFHEEVLTLSKVRHPHLVTLIGACMNPESLALVYEFLPGGSLEDHLSRKNKTPPLDGQTRIRIALEICSALCFLHSTLRSHGDLKPDNILLDSNYVSKLSDFGTCRQLKHIEGTMTPCHQTVNVTGTFAYMDPDYSSSGVMNPSFDVYSFGVMLLRLATGKDLYVFDGGYNKSLRDIVEMAIEDKDFEKLVDVEWPFKETPEKIAKLGLMCFVPRWRGRPDARRLFESLKDIDSNK